jgi:hypothetical protein
VFLVYPSRGNDPCLSKSSNRRRPPSAASRFGSCCWQAWQRWSSRWWRSWRRSRRSFLSSAAPRSTFLRPRRSSQPNDLIRIRLEIAKPLVCENAVEFHFTPAGDQTTVRWSMTGRNGFVGKLFSLCCNMDKMVGGDFEQGLAQMKQVAEAAARK